VRDRDYLLDCHGVIFKVIGDVHPETHYLGYVKYYPDHNGDRRLFDQVYRQNTVVSKSFGILANRPECYVYSQVLGCVITGIPRQDLSKHYSCRQMLAHIHKEPAQVSGTRAGPDLLAIIARIVDEGLEEYFGVTGSFLVGCFTERSDIDLVCYGETGYKAAQALFGDTTLIKPYEGTELAQLYNRRAKYMAGCDFDLLIKQELRKYQGLTANANVHIN
jgi:predicted nucleotidyltransferase